MLMFLVELEYPARVESKRLPGTPAVPWTHLLHVLYVLQKPFATSNTLLSGKLSATPQKAAAPPF
jgi:hypothetical protein